MKITEHQHQKIIFDWAYLNRLKYPCLNLMFAIPNGGLRNIVTAKKLKAEGVKSGVPDIFLPHAVTPFHGLFIELKSQGGKLSDNQKHFIHNLKNQGYFTAVCIGAEQSIKTIQNYLNGGIYEGNA